MRLALARPCGAADRRSAAAGRGHAFRRPGPGACRIPCERPARRPRHRIARPPDRRQLRRVGVSPARPEARRDQRRLVRRRAVPPSDLCRAAGDQPDRQWPQDAGRDRQGRGRSAERDRAEARLVRAARVRRPRRSRRAARHRRLCRARRPREDRRRACRTRCRASRRDGRAFGFDAGADRRSAGRGRGHHDLRRGDDREHGRALCHAAGRSTGWMRKAGPGEAGRSGRRSRSRPNGPNGCSIARRCR